MEVSTEVVQSLRVLGLPSDATADDVRSAFRRLARVYHPDVAGRLYSRKFEQIAKAYALLKDAPLAKASSGSGFSRHPGTEGAHETPDDAGRRSSFRDVFGSPFAWYQKKRAERAAAGESEKAKKERTRSAAESARNKILLEREARIESVLSRGERSIADFTGSMERAARRAGIQGLVTRLTSDIFQVRCLALAHLGELANQPEIIDAISGALKKWDIDEKTARLVSALTLTPENHRRLARGLAAKAGAMPNSLLSYLLQLYNPYASDSCAADPALLEAYLGNAGAGGVSLIMKRWPGNAFVSESLLCRLISNDDESVLITTLSAMKQRSVPCPEAGRERLSAHLSHPNLAVRVWAKALLNTA